MFEFSAVFGTVLWRGNFVCRNHQCRVTQILLSVTTSSENEKTSTWEYCVVWNQEGIITVTSLIFWTVTRFFLLFNVKKCYSGKTIFPFQSWFYWSLWLLVILCRLNWRNASSPKTSRNTARNFASFLALINEQFCFFNLVVFLFFNSFEFFKLLLIVFDYCFVKKSSVHKSEITQKWIKFKNEVNCSYDFSSFYFIRLSIISGF